MLGDAADGGARATTRRRGPAQAAHACVFVLDQVGARASPETAASLRWTRRASPTSQPAHSPGPSRGRDRTARSHTGWCRCTGQASGLVARVGPCSLAPPRGSSRCPGTGPVPARGSRQTVQRLTDAGWAAGAVAAQRPSDTASSSGWTVQGDRGGGGTGPAGPWRWQACGSATCFAGRNSAPRCRGCGCNSLANRGLPCRCIPGAVASSGLATAAASIHISGSPCGEAAGCPRVSGGSRLHPHGPSPAVMLRTAFLVGNGCCC